MPTKIERHRQQSPVGIKTGQAEQAEPRLMADIHHMLTAGELFAAIFSASFGVTRPSSGHGRADQSKTCLRQVD